MAEQAEQKEVKMQYGEFAQVCSEAREGEVSDAQYDWANQA